MSTRERMRVMLEWFGRRQTIALPINSVVGCLIATILLMILSENNVRTLTLLLGDCTSFAGGWSPQSRIGTSLHPTAVDPVGCDDVQ